MDYSPYNIVVSYTLGKTGRLPTKACTSRMCQMLLCSPNFDTIQIKKEKGNSSQEQLTVYLFNN